MNIDMCTFCNGCPYKDKDECIECGKTCNGCVKGDCNESKEDKIL